MWHYRSIIRIIVIVVMCGGSDAKEVSQSVSRAAMQSLLYNVNKWDVFV